MLGETLEHPFLPRLPTLIQESRVKGPGRKQQRVVGDRFRAPGCPAGPRRAPPNPRHQEGRAGTTFETPARPPAAAQPSLPRFPLRPAVLRGAGRKQP